MQAGRKELEAINRSPLAIMVGGAPFNDRFQRVFGSSLTPQSVMPVLHQADQGYLWSIADLTEEILERDGNLQAVMSKRVEQVSGSDWTCEPPPDSGERGLEVAKFCEARLREIEATTDTSRDFCEAIADMMMAIYYGRGGFELIWARDGSFFTPRTLEWIHPRRYAYVTDWRLHVWDASGTETEMMTPAAGLSKGAFGKFPGLPVAGFPPGKFMVHRPRVRGTYPTREGLARTLLWYGLFKRFAIRDWMAFAEWAGRGLRVGTYQTGQQENQRAGNEDVDALRLALELMTSACAVTIPDTTTVDIIPPPATNDVHERLIQLVDMEESKCILGETLTTSVGSTGGNRALGQVHEGMLLLKKKNDARGLGGTIRRDVLRPLVRMNFGEAAVKLTPTLKFAVEPPENMDALAERVRGMVKDTGLEVGQKFARKALKIPDPEAGEKLLGAAPEGEEPQDPESNKQPETAKKEAE